MKKITKVLALFALSSTMLVGCKNKDNQGSGDQSGETSGEPVVEKDWSDAQKELMSSHLHGIVLPFLDKKGVNVEWDADHSTLVVEGPQMALADTAAYAALFKASEGWDGGDDSEDWYEDPDSGMHYYFEKFVSTSAGKRGISVEFGLFDSEDYLAEEGAFYLEAYDEFLYEWPEEAAEEYAASFYPAETPAADMDFAPAFTGGYVYDYYDSAKMISAQVEEAPDEDHLDCGYSAVLTAAGWNVKEGRDAYGYFSAVSPDGKYQLSYLYRTSRGNFAVYFEETAGPIWPAEKISAYLDDGGVATLPALEKEESGWTYQWNGENDGYGWVAVFGADLEALQGYYTTLLTAGFTALDETSSESQQRVLAVKTFSTGVLNVYAYFDDDPTAVIIGVALDELPVWPADKIAALYGESVTDVVPAYTGTTFGYTFNKAGKFLHINLFDPSLVAAAKADYLELFTGWSVVPSTGDYGNYYVSPNNQIVIQFYDANAAAGILTILFKEPKDLPVADWPTAAVAEIARSSLGDVVPALNGAQSYTGPTYHSGYDAYYVSCSFATAAAAQEAYTAYKAALDAEESIWTYDSSVYWYYTANHDVGLDVSWSSGSTSVTIWFTQAPFRAWPATDIASMLDVEHDVVPALNGGITYVITEGSSYSYVDVEFESAEAATAALAAYASALEGTWTYDPDEEWYFTSNGEVGIYFTQLKDSSSNLTAYVRVYFFAVPEPAGYASWAELLTAVAALTSSSNNLPAPSGTPVSYSLVGTQIVVTYADAASATAAAEAYGTAINDSGSFIYYNFGTEEEPEYYFLAKDYSYVVTGWGASGCWYS